MDSVEGDLSILTFGQVDVFALGSYDLIYSAVDSFGNRSEVDRTVEVVDTKAPIIDLIGDAEVDHPVNVPYIEPGAVAYDSFEGAVAVSVEGNVDQSTIGAYTLVYTAVDSSGNEGSVSRLVEVLPAVAVVSDSVEGVAGTEVVVPFSVYNFEGVSGLQFSLDWDASIAELITEDGGSGPLKPKISQVANIQLGEVPFPIVGPQNFAIMSETNGGKMTFLWDEAFVPDQGRSLDDATVMFALHFKLIGEAGSRTTIRVMDDPTPYKVVPAAEGETFLAYTSDANIHILNTVQLAGKVFFLISNSSIHGAQVKVETDEETATILTDSNGSYALNLLSSARYLFDVSFGDPEKPSKALMSPTSSICERIS